MIENLLEMLPELEKALEENKESVFVLYEDFSFAIFEKHPIKHTIDNAE